MTSEGYWARFSRLALRSLNCLPQSRQRNRRYPWAVHSGRSVTAADPQHTQSIPGPHTTEPEAYQGSLIWKIAQLARTLTEPLCPVVEARLDQLQNPPHP